MTQRTVSATKKYKLQLSSQIHRPARLKCSKIMNNHDLNVEDALFKVIIKANNLMIISTALVYLASGELKLQLFILFLENLIAVVYLVSGELKLQLYILFLENLNCSCISCLENRNCSYPPLMLS